ncbi:hypothetical protein Hanom_Chr15g01353871 [Helianthus anomalus]
MYRLYTGKEKVKTNSKGIKESWFTRSTMIYLVPKGAKLEFDTNGINAKSKIID